MNLIHFFAKFGKSPNLWGISMIFFCILQNPKIRKFFVQSQVTLLHLWLLRLDELLVFDSWQLHSFNPYEGASQEFSTTKNLVIYNYQLYNRGVFWGKSSQTLLCWFYIVIQYLIN